MFVNFGKRVLARSCSVKELTRNIAKTTSVTRSDAITSRNNDPKGNTVEKQTKNNMKKYRRLLSTLQSADISEAVLASKVERREFMAVFPDIVRDIIHSGTYGDVPEATKLLGKVLQYNVPNGKKQRGLAVVLSYKHLASPEDLTPENIRLANIAGWCIELLQAYFLIADDIMDGSTSRRGMPSWYTVPEVGLSAINDALLVENSIYILLSKYFRNKPYYFHLMELFHNVNFKTALGQCFDLQCTKGGKPQLDQFTMTRYESICKYKTAYYSFQAPVAIAMHMAGIDDPEMHRQASTIMLEMGHFFQVQDDFLDCFGDPEITGKAGTDIQEGKCTWLAVVALQRATPEQREIMERCYGSDKVEDVAEIKDLYEKLNIPNIFAIYEEESYNLIRTHIQQISRGLPHALFFKFFEKIYKRDH